MKLRIVQLVCELLPGRTTQSDSDSGPLNRVHCEASVTDFALVKMNGAAERERERERERVGEGQRQTQRRTKRESKRLGGDKTGSKGFVLMGIERLFSTKAMMCVKRARNRIQT